MKNIVSLIYIFLITLVSAQSDYISFLKSRTHSNIISLNGDDWEIMDEATSEWQRNVVPSSYLSKGSLLYRKKIFIKKSMKYNQNIFHIGGIQNNAIIRINGEVLASYHYNGAPFKFIIDPTKLYFDQENTIEIVVNNVLDFTSSFPRKIISIHPEQTGGITKDIYIESIEPHPVGDVQLNREDKSVSFALTQLEQDSLRYYNFRIGLLFRTLDLDTIEYTESFQVGRRLNSSKVTVDLSRVFRRSKQDLLEQNLYLETTVTYLQNKNEYPKPKHVQFFSVEKKEVPLKLIAKVEQFSEENYLEQIKDDVEKIVSAGFNGIYFPTDYPHPMYDYYAKKYNLRLFVGVPTFSLTESQMKLAETKTYIENYITKADHYSGVEFILDNMSHSEINKTLANEFNIHAIFGNTLYYNGKTLPVFLPKAGKHGDLDGFLKPYSEEYQAKELREFIKRHSSEEFLIFYYNDFKTPLSDVTQIQLGKPTLAPLGLVSLDRSDKKAFRVIKALLTDQQELAFNPGIKVVKDEYSFITLGIIILALLVIGLKQAVRVMDGIKRALFHAHGLFSDTRDRRTLYMGQTLFIKFVLILIVGNIIAVFIYHFREKALVTAVVNYVFSYETAAGILNALTHPVYVQLWAILFAFLFFLLLSFFTRLPSFMRKSRPSFKQCITITIWACVPLLFLWPVSTILFNALSIGTPIEYMNYYIGFILLWSFFRWVNGARVLNDVGHFKILIYSLFLAVVTASLVWLNLDYFKHIEAYLDYFQYLAQLN